MRITERQLRRIVRQEILRESKDQEQAAGSLDSQSSTVVKTLASELDIKGPAVSYIVSGLKKSDSNERTPQENKALADLLYSIAATDDTTKLSKITALIKKLKQEKPKA